MSRLEIARQLIKENDHALARDLLARNPSTEEEYHTLSLLYRHFHQYDEESGLVTQALDQFPSWEYMRERQEWHSRPLFHPDVSKSKVVPRPPLHLERDPETTPSQEVLEQLCFVTAGGSNEPYRTLLFELLESMQATRLYKNIPILIFDTGLLEADKTLLLNTFENIKEIKDPGWDVDENTVRKYLQKENINGYKAAISRPFIPEHFPGYRYYLWFDSDVWIQDERALDEIIYLAEKQGIAACPDVVPSFSQYYKDIVLEKFKTQHILQSPSIMVGLFCIDIQSEFFAQWKFFFLEHIEAGLLNHFTEQLSMNLIFSLSDSQLKLPPLQKTQFIFHPFEFCLGCPAYKNNILYNDNKEIGILHLTWYSKNTHRYYRPLLKNDHISIEKGQMIEKSLLHNTQVSGEHIIYGSVAYRRFPNIKKELKVFEETI